MTPEANLQPSIDPDLLAAGYSTPINKVVRGGDKLKGVQPELLDHWNSLRGEFDQAGIQPEIKSGYRTAQQQHALFTNPATAAKTKGNDGYINISPHQEGRALDISFNAAQKARGRQIIADYAKRTGLHVPSDEPWHIALAPQGAKQLDPDLLQAGYGDGQSAAPKQAAPSTQPTIDPDLLAAGYGNAVPQKRVNPFARVKAGVQGQTPQTIDAGDAYSTPSGLVRRETPSMQARHPGIIERATEAIKPYVPGLTSLDTPMGIKTDPVRGLVRGLTLGAAGDSREITPEERLVNPNAEAQRNFAEGAGETLGAVVPYVGAAKVLEAVPVLSRATRAAHIARNALTFGGVETAREAIKAAKTGEPINPTDIAMSTAMGGTMGAIAGVSPSMKRQIVAFLAPQVAVDVSRGTPLEQAIPNALTTLGFALTSGAEWKPTRKFNPEALNARQAETQRQGVQTEQPAETVQPERVDVGLPDRIVSESGQPAQRFQHLQFGEVEVLADQSGARPGKIRVAEVSDPTKQHFVRKSDMQGRGNARMIPVKPAETAAEAAPAVPPETLPVEGARTAIQTPSQPVEPSVGEGEKPFETTNEVHTYLDSLNNPEFSKYAKAYNALAPNEPEGQAWVNFVNQYTGRTQASGASYEAHRRYFDERLENPKLTDRGIYVPSEQGDLFAVPVGGKRRHGASSTLFDKAEGERLLKKIAGVPGFENARLRPVSDKFSLEWGGPSPGYRSETNTTEDIGRAYGYSEKAISEFVARHHQPSPQGEVVKSKQYPVADRGEWYSNADYAKRGGNVVEMSPDEFLAQAKPLELDEVARDNIDDLKRHIESGRTLDPAALYADGKTDGRHRAIAAKELGIISIPVIDFRAQAKPEQKGEPNVAQKALAPANLQNTSDEAADGRGASQGEVLPPAPSTEGVPVKTAAIEAERVAAGLDPIEKQQYRNIGESFLAGKKAVDEGHVDPRALAAEVARVERPLRGDEIGALGYDRTRLRNEYDAKISQLSAAIDSKDTQGIASHRAQLEEIERLADVNDAALEKGGREQSIAFNARKMLVGRDYSLLGALQRAKAFKGAELTPEERGRIETLTKQLADAEKTIADYESKKGHGNIRRFISDAEKEIRKQGRSAKKEVLDQEFAQLSQQFHAKMTGIQPAGIDPTLVPIIAKMARNRVQAGFNTVEGLVDELHSHLKDVIEDKRALRDAFSGYGQEPKQRTRDEVAEDLNRLKREARKLSKEEDKNPVTEAAKQEAAKQKSVKTRLTNQIADLENQLKTGNFAKTVRAKLEYDRDAERLLAHRDLLKDRIEREIAKQKKPLWEDYLTWWQQGTILSGTRTLAKLGSYALGKNVIIPIEDVISGGMSHVPGLRGLSKASPRYGGGIRENIVAQGAAFKEFVNKAMYQDAWTSLKEGTNALKLKHGDSRYQYSPRLLTFIRGLHMAEKVFASRPEYYRSIEKETQWAVRNGLDPANPKVQSQILSRAYMNGLRAQLMQPNIPSKILSTTNQWLESVGRTGKVGQIQEPGVSYAARSIRTGIRTLFPITRVPFNYVNESLSYNPVGGALKGGGRMAAEAVKTLRSKGIGKGIIELTQQGMSKMPPEAADATKRALVKGSLGIPFALIGWYNYKNIGGYYQPGQRKEGDVPFGGLRIGGVEIPRALVHNPLFETMHFFATMRRVYEGDKDGGDLTHAVGEAAAGATEEVPFIDVPLRIGKAWENKTGFRNMAGEIVRSATIPPDVQRIAAMSDSAEPTTKLQKALQVTGLKDVKTVKRSPHGFGQTYEMGVPGLRQRVPINEKAAKADMRQSLIDRKRRGEDVDLQGMVASDKITKADQKAIELASGMTEAQTRFHNTPPNVALDRFERMDTRQRAAVQDLMEKKAYSLLHSDSLTDAQKAKFQQRIDALGIEPKASQRKSSSSGFKGAFKNQFANSF